MSDNIKSDTIERLSNNKILKITLSIIAIVGTIVTIYAAFFQEQHCNLQYIVTASTNVLDINADVSKLDILFDGTSLKEKEENIRIINVKIANTGNKDITIDFYDENDPIGIIISEGILIDKPELIASSSDYLERNLKGKIFSDSTKVKFPRIIIETEEFFILKLMIIHKSNTTPLISSIGKIAGQKEIAIIQTIDKKELPLLLKTFQGNVWIQIIRLLIYTIVTIFIVIVVVIVVEKISTLRNKTKSKKLINKFKSHKDYNYTKMDDAIFDRFIDEGNSFMESMITITENEEKLNQLYNTSLEKVEKKPQMYSSSDDGIASAVNYESTSERNLRLINEMLSDGIIIKEGKKLKINQTMRKTILLLIEFLKENVKEKKKKGKRVIEPVHPIDV